MEDQQKTEVKASIDEGGNTEASASSDPNASEASADPAADGAADASASEKTFWDVDRVSNQWNISCD